MSFFAWASTDDVIHKVVKSQQGVCVFTSDTSRLILPRKTIFIQFL